jgi:hypothetical protein
MFIFHITSSSPSSKLRSVCGCVSYLFLGGWLVNHLTKVISCIVSSIAGQGNIPSMPSIYVCRDYIIILVAVFMTTSF